MGPLGFPELIVIFVVALLVFGPRKLPDIGRSLGKSLNEFKRASNDLKRTWEREVQAEEEDLRKTITREKEELDEIADSLNTRPRKTLDWRTPLEVYAEVLKKSVAVPSTLQ